MPGSNGTGPSPRRPGAGPARWEPRPRIGFAFAAPPPRRMRRADRLFAIVQYLRGRRLTTAAQLARWLEVSERTIYRDISHLAASGVPIDGEAGIGYRVRARSEEHTSELQLRG